MEGIDQKMDIFFMYKYICNLISTKTHVSFPLQYTYLSPMCPDSLNIYGHIDIGTCL